MPLTVVVGHRVAGGFGAGRSRAVPRPAASRPCMPSESVTALTAPAKFPVPAVGALVDERMRSVRRRGRIRRVTDQSHWDPRIVVPPEVVHPVRVDPTGSMGPTKAAAAGPGWRRTGRGLYVPRSVDPDLPEQRVVEQAARLDGCGAVTGWAACRLHGARFFDGRVRDRLLPVDLVMTAGGRVRGGDEAAITREPLPAGQVVTRYGVPVTSVRRALFDEMRRPGGWRAAVVAMDMMAAAGLVSIAQMSAFLSEHSAWRRSRQVQHALDRASERSRSPGESRMRMIWHVDAGLPRPLVNQEIFTREGRLLGVADLFDPVVGLVGEYDGVDHLRPWRRRRDLEREETMRKAGLEYVTAVGPDLATPGRLAGRIRSAYDRARRSVGLLRSWTLDPPTGWPREESLDERLFLREMSARCDAGGGKCHEL